MATRLVLMGGRGAIRNSNTITLTSCISGRHTPVSIPLSSQYTQSSRLLPASASFPVTCLSQLNFCRTLCSGGAQPPPPASRDIPAEITSLVNRAKVVVFMKGVPDAPRCGFSNAVVQIMAMHDVPYEAHDILIDEELRQGIKDFSNWPTIPQVYVGGEFIGGCDIMLQMHQNGELVEELGKVGIRSALLPTEKSET